MIPLTLLSLLQATTAANFAKNAPTVITQLNNQQPTDWTDSDKELINKFHDTAYHYMQNGGQNFANIAVGFQELSHNQKMEVLNKLDLSKLDAAGTAKIAQTEIEEGHKTTRFSTLITAVTFTVGILAVFSSTNKTSDNNYKLRRPRSLSEKIFGDKQ